MHQDTEILFTPFDKAMFPVYLCQISVTTLAVHPTERSERRHCPPVNTKSLPIIHDNLKTYKPNSTTPAIYIQV